MTTMTLASDLNFYDISNNDLNTWEWQDRFSDIMDELKADYASYEYATYNEQELIVATNGNIYNAKTLKMYSKTPHSLGYLVVVLKGKFFLQHRIIAETFIPNPDNLATVDHILPDKTNNSIDNLQWMTLENNVRKSNKVKKQHKQVIQN